MDDRSKFLGFGQNFGGLFQMFDRDGSGEVDADELRIGLRSILKINESAVSDADIASLLGVIDIDGDGTIELHELAALISDGDAGKAHQRASQRAAEVDAAARVAEEEEAAVARDAAALAASGEAGGLELKAVGVSAGAAVARANTIDATAFIAAVAAEAKGGAEGGGEGGGGGSGGGGGGSDDEGTEKARATPVVPRDEREESVRQWIRSKLGDGAAAMLPATAPDAAEPLLEQVCVRACARAQGWGVQPNARVQVNAQVKRRESRVLYPILLSVTLPACARSSTMGRYFAPSLTRFSLGSSPIRSPPLPLAAAPTSGGAAEAAVA